MTEPSFRFFASSVAVAASLLGLGVLTFQPATLTQCLTTIMGGGFWDSRRG